MISSMADDSPLPSLTSESQPDGFRTASVRPECHPLYPSPSSSESMLASKAFLPFPPFHPPPLSWITSSTPSVLERPSRPLLAPCPTGCWACTQSHRAGVHATVAGDMLLLLAEGLAPLPTGQGQEWWPPRSPKRRANKRKQTKNRGEPSGLQEEGRGSPGQGNGVHLVNASGLETGNGGGRPKEAMRAWRDSQEEGERAVMQLGTNLLLLYQILSQSIGVC